MLTAVILSSSISGCVSNDDIKTGYENINQAEENVDLFPFLTQSNEGLRFNFTINDYLDRYNAIKEYYGYENNEDISFSDLFLVDSAVDYNGKEIDVYGFCKSVLGENGNVCIMLCVDDSGYLTALRLAINDYDSFSEDDKKALMTQYRMVIQSLDIPEKSAERYIIEMEENYENYNVYATYKNGLALSADTDKSGVTYYRVNPYTVKQWESTYGLGFDEIK